MYAQIGIVAYNGLPEDQRKWLEDSDDYDKFVVVDDGDASLQRSIVIAEQLTVAEVLQEAAFGEELMVDRASPEYKFLAGLGFSKYKSRYGDVVFTVDSRKGERCQLHGQERSHTS